MSELEKLSEQIHRVYCDYHRQVKGAEYWTKGDYSLLDDDTKEADRFMARFLQSQLTTKEEEISTLKAQLAVLEDAILQYAPHKQTREAKLDFIRWCSEQEPRESNTALLGRLYKILSGEAVQALEGES